MNAKKVVVTIISILTLFEIKFSNAQSYAQANHAPCCCGYELNVFPSKKQLDSNGCILIEGYGDAQKVIENLGAKNKVYMVHNATRIKMNVIDSAKGAHYTKEALLKPEQPLHLGWKYHLEIEGITEADLLHNRWGESFGKKLPKWQIVKADSSSFNGVWDTFPKFKKYESIIFQCCNMSFNYECSYDAEFVSFQCLLDSNHVSLMKVNYTNDSTQETRTYFIEPQYKNIELEDVNCYGGFKFGENNSFHITFDVIDKSGRLIKWNRKPIHFVTKSRY